MDGEAIRFGAENTVAEQRESTAFWTNAKRRFESLLNSICNIVPHHDLDAYECQRIETLVDALDRAAQIRRKYQYLESCQPRTLVDSLERTTGFATDD
jgi:hypothetical protein